MAKAFLVVELTITDPEGYERYRAQVLPGITAVGGRFVVRGGQRVQLEGADQAHNDALRTIIVEFPSMAVAHAWYESPAYTELKTLRINASSGRAFLVEGA